MPTQTIQGIPIEILENNDTTTYPRVLFNENNTIYAAGATQVNNVNNNNIGIYVKQQGQYYFVPKYVPPNPANYIYGMVLVQEGGGSGTWVRVDENFNTVKFDSNHGTWKNIKTITNSIGDFVEIPITYVKAETLQSGPYAGKNCWWIADGYVDGFHIHPCFIGSDGKPHNLKISTWIISNDGNNNPISVQKDYKRENYWLEISNSDAHDLVLSLNGNGNSGYRMYNIYDHHFLARMMLTEFGTPDASLYVTDGIRWDGRNNEIYNTHSINYHGLHDPFGTGACYVGIMIDGLFCKMGKYFIVKNDGSGEVINTNLNSRAFNKYNLHYEIVVYTSNCRLDKYNYCDFGDIFLPTDYSPAPTEDEFYGTSNIFYNQYLAETLTYEEFLNKLNYYGYNQIKYEYDRDGEKFGIYANSFKNNRSFRSPYIERSPNTYDNITDFGFNTIWDMVNDEDDDFGPFYLRTEVLYPSNYLGFRISQLSD